MNKLIHSNSLCIPINILGITLLSTLVLLSSSVSADNDTVVDEVNVTVPISCTLSGTGMNSHNANINNGQYNSAIGETTMKVYCNDNEGFAIYAIGYTDNTDGKNVLSNSTLGSTNDIVTGTSTTGATSNWAMKLSTITSPTPTYPLVIQSDTEGSFTNFHTVPDEYTIVAKRESSTDIGSNAEGSTLKSTYQAYVSPTQPAGTYTGQVKYVLVHPHDEEPLSPQPAVAGKIVYHKNSLTAIGTMANQDATDGNTVMLYPSNFSRAGYGFAGWSDAYDYATNPNAHFYGPIEDITVPSGTTSNGLSLYAVWIKSAGNLQDTAKVTQLCGTNGVGGSLTPVAYDDGDDADESTWSITADLSSVSALTDARDNQTYAIAKLSDGNCWMIENLRLESQYTTGETNKALAQGYGTSTTYGNFIGLAGSEAPWANGSTTANDLYSTNGSNDTININSTNRPAQRFPRYNNYNTASRATNTTNSENIYSYGNYYTWSAAIADTSFYLSDNHDSTSICPKGWKIPTGHSESDTSNGQYGELNKSLGGYLNGNGVTSGMNNSTSPTGAIMSQRLRHFPNNYVFSGNVYNGSITARGVNGFYGTSTPFSDYVYTLTIGNTGVSPGTAYNGIYKYHGRPIRCMVGVTTSP